MTVEIPVPVELPAGLRKRFYEPLVFLWCLKEIFNRENKTRTSTRIRDSVAMAESSRQQMYFDFVNKLAQICDFEKGKDTITAFAVMNPGMVMYYFASNNRDQSALEEVQDYITDILTMLGSASDEDLRNASSADHPLYNELLRKILRFNRPRIEHYVRNMAEELSSCNEYLVDRPGDETPEAKAVVEHFHGLEPLVKFALRDPQFKNPKVSVDDYVDACEKLLYTLDMRYRTSIEDFVRNKANASRRRDGSTETACWGNMHHAIGRLMSYFFAVKILIGTRRLWPELFEMENVLVHPIPSSGPGDTPDIRKSMHSIVTRMTSDKASLARYRAHEARLRQLGMDTMIREVTHPRRFQPVVHAELQVDAFVRREERRRGSDDPDAEPLHFFAEEEFGRYIGASKPTCWLCARWFGEEHPDGTQVRPTHKNLYHNWRPAEVFESDGVEVEEHRRTVLEAMVKALRNETLRCVKNQWAVRNPFDSNNTPTDPLWEAGPTSSLVMMLGDMSVGSVSPASSRESTPEDERREELIRRYKALQHELAQVGHGGEDSGLDGKEIALKKGGRITLQETN